MIARRVAIARRPAGVVALALAFAFALPAPSYALLDKTRFAAHLGIAYFAFHHFVMRPFQAGAFETGAPHRISTIVKGGAALLFAVHEVRVAQRIADKSNDPLLHKVSGGVASLAASFAAVGTTLKSGHFSPDDLHKLDGQTQDVNSDATAAGTPIKDVPAAIPGT